MLSFNVPHYIIIDFQNRNVEVIAESDNRKEAEKVMREECGIYKEQEQEFYRVICPVVSVRSERD